MYNCAKLPKIAPYLQQIFYDYNQGVQKKHKCIYLVKCIFSFCWSSVFPFGDVYYSWFLRTFQLKIFKRLNSVTSFWLTGWVQGWQSALYINAPLTIVLASFLAWKVHSEHLWHQESGHKRPSPMKRGIRILPLILPTQIGKTEKKKIKLLPPFSLLSVSSPQLDNKLLQHRTK